MFRNSGAPRTSFRFSRTPFSWRLSCSRRLSVRIRPGKTKNPHHHRVYSPGPRQYKQQFADTLTMLRNAKARFETGRLRSANHPHHHAAFSGIHARHVERGGAGVFSRSRCPRQKRKRLDQHRPRLDEGKGRSRAGAAAGRDFGAGQQSVRQRGCRRKRRRPLEGRARGGGNHKISRGSRRQRPRQFSIRGDCQRAGLHAVLPRFVSSGPGTSICDCSGIGERGRRSDGRAARPGSNAPGAGLRTGNARAATWQTSPARSIRKPAGRTWASIFLPRR